MEGDIIKVDNYNYYVVNKNDDTWDCYRLTTKKKRDRRLKGIAHIPAEKAAKAVIVMQAVQRDEK